MGDRRVLWKNKEEGSSIYTILFEDNGRLYPDLSYANASNTAEKDRDKVSEYIQGYVDSLTENNLRELWNDMGWHMTRWLNARDDEWESIPEELRDRLEQQFVLFML